MDLEGNQPPRQRWIAGKLRRIHKNGGYRLTVRASGNPDAFTPEGPKVSMTQDRQIWKVVGTREIVYT